MSEAALKASIIERLNAIHVDITDMSGSSPKQHRPVPRLSYTLVLTLFQAAVARPSQP